MALRFHNTLTRKIEDFVPLDPAGKHVGLYCCGPTVYDFAHIGNWRTFVFADLVRRTLELAGHNVRHVMNITDVEDKIIRKVRETGQTLREYWNGEPRGFLGTTVPGFPNFFMLYGPGTNGGEIVTSLLAQSGHALRAILRMMREGTTAVEVKPFWADVWHAWLQDGMRGTAWTTSRNYFKNAAGKIVTQWPYGAQSYRLLTRLLSGPSLTTRRLGETAND